MNARETLAANLRRERKTRGLSQQALAKRARLIHCRIDSIERGERSISIDDLWRLGRALGIEPADLLAPISPRGQVHLPDSMSG